MLPTMYTVEYSRQTGTLILDDEAQTVIEVNPEDAFFCPRAQIADCSAQSLSDAMKDAFDHCEEMPVEFLVSDDATEWFDIEESHIHYTSLLLRGPTLKVRFVTTVLEIDEESDRADQIRKIISPMLTQHGGTLETNEMHPGGARPPWPWIVEFSIPLEDQSVSDLLALADAMNDLLEASEGDGLTQHSLWRLLTSGHTDALRGLAENGWFDAKREPYPQTELGRLDVALDVAKFANANGGIILIGATTSKLDGIDTVTGFVPVQNPNNVVSSHRDSIAARVFPVPEALTVITCQGPRGPMVGINVPEQSEDAKPFLVHGTLVDSKYKGGFFSIPIRNGEGALNTSPKEIHAYLRAGRRLIDGDQGATAPIPQLRLAPAEGEAVAVKNVGDGDAYTIDVEVLSQPGSGDAIVTMSDCPSLPTGSSVNMFLKTPTANSLEPAFVLVKWSDSDGNKYQDTMPLP